MKYTPLCIPALIVMTAFVTACQDTEMTTKANAAPAAKGAAAGPIVVELFQSQGCSSCPPANLALNAESGRSDVIALNFSVTYWDKLGWKDIFGDPAYTERQYDYARSFKDGQVYTPQVVLNGRRFMVGNGPGEIRSAIAASKPISGGPVISSTAGKAIIGSGTGKATVWLVRYDPRVQNVAIKSGENSGRTLPHRNIVRQLVKLGDWNGQAASYALPGSAAASYKSVILVQKPGGGAIYSAKVL
jgi:hypothetical protein